MWKLLSLTLVAALTLVTTEAKAVVICDGYTPDIEILSSFGHVNRDLSLRAVKLRSDEAWGELMVDHIYGQAALTNETEFNTAMAKNGYEGCKIISKVTILYKLNATMRIVNDYPKDSCFAKQVAQHEAKHIATAKDFQAQTVPMLKEYVEKAMKGKAGMVMMVGQDQKAEAFMQGTMNNLLQEYSKYLNQQHKKLQASIVDTPEERQRILAGCKK